MRMWGKYMEYSLENRSTRHKYKPTGNHSRQDYGSTDCIIDCNDTTRNSL